MRPIQPAKGGPGCRSLLIPPLWVQDKNSLRGDRMDGERRRVDCKLLCPLKLPWAQEDFYTQKIQVRDSDQKFRSDIKPVNFGPLLSTWAIQISTFGNLTWLVEELNVPEAKECSVLKSWSHIGTALTDLCAQMCRCAHLTPTHQMRCIFQPDLFCQSSLHQGTCFGGTNSKPQQSLRQTNTGFISMSSGDKLGHFDDMLWINRKSADSEIRYRSQFSIKQRGVSVSFKCFLTTT